MKMIKPIVNISKILDNYHLVVTGLEGVISEGGNILPEAKEALIKMKKSGQRLILLTNSPLRVHSIIQLLRNNGLPPLVFDNIVSAGEILHYLFKYREGDFATIGTTYYNLGQGADTAIFSFLDYLPVDKLGKADFLFMGSAAAPEATIDQYMQILEYAASMNIPLVCAGNDTSSFQNGEICLAAGAVAEQYAALGGRIITVGKPDPKILSYTLEGTDDISPENILLIGDNITTDIKGANLSGVDCVLVSKGVHVNFLGEGYIPDVAKTREMPNNYDAYPDYVISNLRW